MHGVGDHLIKLVDASAEAAHGLCFPWGLLTTRFHLLSQLVFEELCYMLLFDHRSENAGSFLLYAELSLSRGAPL